MKAPVRKNAQFATEIDEQTIDHGSVKDIEDGMVRKGSQHDIFVGSGDALLSKLDLNRYCLRLHNSCTIWMHWPLIKLIANCRRPVKTTIHTLWRRQTRILSNRSPIAINNKRRPEEKNRWAWVHGCWTEGNDRSSQGNDRSTTGVSFYVGRWGGPAACRQLISEQRGGTADWRQLVSHHSRKKR